MIGGGSAGLVSAYIAAAVKAKVTLVEQHKLGGDCLNTGCVPSKALIRSARLLSHMRRSREFGIREAKAEFDFADVMERVQRVIKTVEPHDSAERYTELGVDVIAGTAKIVSPWEVDITREDGATQRLSTRAIVIAAGARPFVPPIPGIEAVGYLTSDTVWNLRQLPRRLVVLGGGPIGSELTQTFARLGAKVTQVEMAPRILMREDPEVSELVTQRFRAEGIDVLVDHKAKQFVIEDGREHPHRRARRPGRAHCLRRAAGRRRPGGQSERLWPGGTGHPDEPHRRYQRIPANEISQHLRRRRRRRTVSVHAYRGASGLVRGRQCAVRSVQEIPRRLLGDSLGHLRRTGSGARGPERDRSERTRASPTS